MKLFFSHFLRLIILLVLVAAGTFILLSFSPVDPIRAYIGNDLLHVPPEQYARIAARWGLDQPLWERFGHWFWRLLQGDMGYSMLFNMPVASVIRERFATSFALLAGAWLLSGVLGVTLGFLAGRFLHRWPDKMIPYQLLIVIVAHFLDSNAVAGAVCRPLAGITCLLRLGPRK